MAQERPKAIPVMCQMASGHIILNTKVHPIDYFLSNDVWADCLLRMRTPYTGSGCIAMSFIINSVYFGEISRSAWVEKSIRRDIRIFKTVPMRERSRTFSCMYQGIWLAILLV